MDRWAHFTGDEISPVHQSGRGRIGISQWQQSAPLRQLLAGSLAALVAVAIRYAAGWPSNLLPTFTLVIAVCLTTATIGLWAGATTMLVGGVLTWWFIFSPGSWKLNSNDAIGLIGYFMVATVILCTAELYRRSEERRNAAQLALAEQELSNQRLFAAELSHRLKNSLAIVQSIALQSFDGETLEFDKFAGRLRALAAAQDLLNDHVNEPTAGVRDVVEAAIAPFNGERGPFRMEGPDIALPSQDVVSLTMALHELATNAVKYGALSTPKGRVAVTWKIDGGKFLLEWKEHDGPPVGTPARSGFGSRLLRRAAMGADLQFEPDGVRCIIHGR